VQVLQADSNDCISAKAVATYCGYVDIISISMINQYIYISYIFIYLYEKMRCFLFCSFSHTVFPTFTLFHNSCPIPDGACRLCGGDAKVPAANIDVGLDYAASDYIVSAPPGEMLSCESMESYLHTLSADDETCAEITANVTDTCCTGAEDTTSTADENETTDEEEDETSAPAEPSAASTVGITGIVTLGAASAMMMVVTMM